MLPGHLRDMPLVISGLALARLSTELSILSAYQSLLRDIYGFRGAAAEIFLLCVAVRHL